MPLLEGWSTDNRLLLLHLVRAINELEQRDRRDKVHLHPEMVRARVEMLAYIKRGGTSATHASELCGTQSVPPVAPIAMLSVKVTSSALGLSESYVRRLCRRRKLPAIRERNEWLIDPESVAQRRQLKEHA